MIERVLGAALRRGGEFAEVFVEDRARHLGRARRRSGGGAVLGPRPGRRGPGGGGRDHRLRPHRRPSEAGLLAAAEAAAGRGPRGRGGGTVVALAPRHAPRALRRDHLPRRRRQGPQDRAPGPGRRRGPSAGAAPSPRCRPPTATAGGASWWPTATGCSPPTTRSARASRVSCVAVGDTGMQTGYESAPSPWASSSSTPSTSREGGRRGGPPGAGQAVGPSRPER